MTIPSTMNVRLRKTVGVLLQQEAAIKAGPAKACSYEKAVERNVLGSVGSLDAKACSLLFRRGLRKVDGGYVFTRDRRLKAAPLFFAPKEDQIYLAREVRCEVMIVKFSEGPYFESVENYREQIEALRSGAKKLVYVEVEGKHHAHLTHPERMASQITDFFNA